MGAESSIVLGASLMDGTCKSRRIMTFGTYHGASVFKCRAFD
jgi:hypothetical protein